MAELSDGREAGVPGEGSVEELERELELEKRKNSEMLTRLKYAQADLENYRKRTEQEMREAGESAARSLASRLLVVQDELDLAVKHARNGTRGEDMVEGIAMVQRNLLSTLQSAGVEKIDAVGMPFDPALHEAVEKALGGTRERDMVVEEVRPGFTFRGQVLRPSMVKVELASKTAREEGKSGE